MVYALIVILIAVCIGLVVTILLQSGQGGGLSAGFGGNFMSGAVFGGKGASGFLTKLTIGLAIVFAVLVIGINIAYKQGPTASSKSIFKDAAPATSSAPMGGGMPSSRPVTPTNAQPTQSAAPVQGERPMQQATSPADGE